MFLSPTRVQYSSGVQLFSRFSLFLKHLSISTLRFELIELPKNTIQKNSLNINMSSPDRLHTNPTSFYLALRGVMANSEAAENLEPVEGKEREVLVRGKKSGEKWKETVHQSRRGRRTRWVSRVARVGRIEEDC
jgi:hypothetical protein